MTSVIIYIENSINIIMKGRPKMKLVAVMFAYKRQIAFKDGKRRCVICRPDYLIISMYNSKTRRFQRLKIVPLRFHPLPQAIVDLMTDPRTYIFAWTDEELLILKALLQEIGISTRSVHLGLITGYLRAHRIPHKTLAKTAQALRVAKCPREGVRTLSLVKKRFDCFRKIIKRLIQINNLLLIDSIWV